MKTIDTVDAYIAKNENGQYDLSLLRTTILATGLQETIKWGMPVYTSGGENVVGLGAFKSHIAIWFFQGALLQDKKNRLINAQEGKTKALRQWRFESIEQIDQETETIKKYVEEAVSNLRQGKAIRRAKQIHVEKSPELDGFPDNNPDVKDCFQTLSPAKQREYVEYINEAKRADTKSRRLKKIATMILDGKGLNDKYIR